LGRASVVARRGGALHGRRTGAEGASPVRPGGRRRGVPGTTGRSAARAKAKADAAIEKGVGAMLRAAGVPVTSVGIGKDSVRVELPRAKLEKALAKA